MKARYCIRAGSPGGRLRAGFTLLELITAMAVFSIGLLGVVVSFQAGMEKVRAANEMRTAQTVVQNEMERLRALPFAELKAEEDAAFTPTASAGLDRMVGVQAVRTVCARDAQGAPIKEVVVTLRWRGDLGRPMQTAITTLITDKGEEK